MSRPSQRLLGLPCAAYVPQQAGAPPAGAGRSGSGAAVAASSSSCPLVRNATQPGVPLQRLASLAGAPARSGSAWPSLVLGAAALPGMKV